MTTKKIYLAGPIAGLTHAEATYGWRQEVFDALHGVHRVSKGVDVLHSAEAVVQIHCYSPMRGKEFLAGQGILGKNGYATNPISTVQGVLGRDRDDCRTADLIFMNLLGADKVSIGTTCELAWADAYRVPVLLCMEEKGNIHDHIFFQGLCTYRVSTLEDGIELAKKFLIPGV